jgi:hypothetical protein
MPYNYIAHSHAFRDEGKAKLFIKCMLIPEVYILVDRREI